MDEYILPVPNTFQPNLNSDPRMERSQVFDPALRHFSRRAFKLGEPIFQDMEIANRWFEARTQVIETILQVIRDSQWHEQMILRGSLLLKGMLGDVAREPADIDWVFRQDGTESIDWLFNKLISELTQMIACFPIDNIKIDTTKIVIDNIWIYSRAEGRRILFPWQVEGLPMGTLQMDVVFGERLFADPILTPIPTLSGDDILIWSASKELSLAWKIRWLETDVYPQGKDLYDATLLAEQTSLPFELLREVLESDENWNMDAKNIENFSWRSGYPWVSELKELEWDNFKLEYPWIEGTMEDWHNRLRLALAPIFSNLDSSIV